jgi:hypothetical protein
LTGLSRRQLDWLLRYGAIEPALGRTGSGSHLQWDLIRTLALASAGAHLRLGAGWERAAGVARYLSTLTVERLEAELAAGRTLPVPATLMREAATQLEALPKDWWLPGMLIEPPQDAPPAARELMRQLELPAMYEELRVVFAALAPKSKAGARSKVKN